MKYRLCHIFACIALAGIYWPGYAEDRQPDGFGAAKWGMSRQVIATREGLPDMIDDVKGTIWYLNKQVMGKPAELGYHFEQGCNDMEASICRFADGVAIFRDGSKAWADELHQYLVHRYGAPFTSSTEVETGSKYYTSSGSKVLQHTHYVWHTGGVKIIQIHTINLHDYTNFAGEIHKAGPAQNRLHYFGPYHK